MLAKLRASFVVAGLALVAGLAAIIALLFGGPDDSAGTLDSFHFVARLAVEPSEYSAHPTVDRIEGWYRAPELVRWEFSYEDPRLRDRRMVDVQDGDWLWTYDGETNT
ncbi:MAG TPA: hypothetical protein VNN10_01550 [Dehalococcoidia bacterium]|nr:hypothetical protein [Dehalococcoidia bacterium]